MIKPDQVPQRSTTQSYLPVADVTEDIILLKDGGAALILESSALNFSLLSEREQQAMIFAYAALLNSLSFPINILVRSQKKDISEYLSYLAEMQEKQSNPQLISLMSSYREFVASTVKKRNVLEKSFYIILPFSPLELGISGNGALGGLSPKKKGRVPYTKSYVVKKAKTVLYPRRDHLLRQVGRLGLKVRQLTTAEIIELLYEVYNPGTEGFEFPVGPLNLEKQPPKQDPTEEKGGQENG